MATGYAQTASFVVRPKPDDFHGFDFRQNLIDQAVLDVDAPGVCATQISDQLFVGRRIRGIRWNNKWVNVSTVCIGDYVGLEEIDNGIWNVYYGMLKPGRFDERTTRIEDAFGRLKRRNV